MGRLLVVENDSVMRGNVRAILASLGYEVIEATDGVEALMIYKALRDDIALVLMDANMPRMDGIATARALKTSDPAAKVILIGGPQRPPNGVPADAFLYKPFRGKELAEVVQHLLGDDHPIPDLP